MLDALQRRRGDSVDLGALLGSGQKEKPKDENKKLGLAPEGANPEKDLEQHKEESNGLLSELGQGQNGSLRNRAAQNWASNKPPPGE